VEAETCSDTVINNNTNKNLLVAIAGILSERFLKEIQFARPPALLGFIKAVTRESSSR
jgi:hypothetical protein